MGEILGQLAMAYELNGYLSPIIKTIN